MFFLWELSLLSAFNRSKMGILESGSFHLHPVCRHSQEPGGSHIQSEIGQSGPVDLRADPGTVSGLYLGL